MRKPTADLSDGEVWVILTALLGPKDYGSWAVVGPMIETYKIAVEHYAELENEAAHWVARILSDEVSADWPWIEAVAPTALQAIRLVAVRDICGEYVNLPFRAYGVKA
jgi:hypothetical protein